MFTYKYTSITWELGWGRKKRSSNNFPQKSKSHAELFVSWISCPAERLMELTLVLASKCMSRCGGNRERPLRQRRKEVKFREIATLRTQGQLKSFPCICWLFGGGSSQWVNGSSSICVLIWLLCTWIPLDIGRPFTEAMSQCWHGVGVWGLEHRLLPPS